MPRKGENIYKRKDGRWEGRYIKERKEEGSIKYGYVYDHSYKGVKSKLETMKGKVYVDNNPKLCEKSYYLKDIADLWFGYIIPNVKYSTQIKYFNLWELYIKEKLGDIPVTEIDYVSIEQHCSFLLQNGGKKATGLSAKTVSDVLALIKRILKYASQRLNLSVCDLSNIVINNRNKKDISILDSADQIKLVKHISLNINARNVGILVCLCTGMRVGEICALRCQDIDIVKKLIYVHSTMQRIKTTDASETRTKITITTPKSKCSIRYIPIPEELLPFIKKILSEKNSFFLSSSPDKYIEPRNLQHYFRRLLTKCNIPATNFHTLRHTFATRCVEMGFDIKSLSEILGHANVNITLNKYVHPSLETKRDNMKLVSTLLAVT